MSHYGGFSAAYRLTALDAIPTVYLHLDTVEADVNDANFTECVGTGYNCPVVPLAAASGGSRVSSAAVQTATAGASWGTPVAWRLTSSATPGAGTLYARGLCPAPTKEIQAGDFYYIAAGQLTVSLTGTVT
jgi:hypothetical protein